MEPWITQALPAIKSTIWNDLDSNKNQLKLWNGC